MNVGINLDNANSGVLSEPLGFSRSGQYNWNPASPGSRDSSVRVWSSHTSASAYSKVQYSDSSNFSSDYGNSKGLGSAVRCV